VSGEMAALTLLLLARVLQCLNHALRQFLGIGMLSHNCPVRWLLSADKSIIEYGF
jgi:hypothetical protein